MTTQHSRIEALDLLRGFALIGILAVNMPWFAHNIYVSPPVDTLFDKGAFWLVAFAGHTKFFILFSFLFGYGLAVQLERAASRGESLGPRYGRRLFGILIFGAIHAVFLFIGDVLVLYAVLGGVLWTLRNWPAARLIRFVVVMLFVSMAGYALLGWVAFELAGENPEYAALAAQATETYRGSFMDAVEQRLRDLPFLYPLIILYNGPSALAMFALGLAAGKVNFFENLEQHWPRMRRALPWALIVGIVGNLVYASAATLDTVGRQGGHAWQAALVMSQLAFAGPALCFAFVVGMLSMHRAGRAQWLQRSLRAAGRMSLTNYMAESVVGGFIFCGWGLGYFGEVGLGACLLLTPVAFAALVAFSAGWLRYFRNGPEEWLLRCWTYLKRQPFRAKRTA